MQCDSWFSSPAEVTTPPPASTVQIRAATVQDTRALAEVLASSFYRRTGWQGWVYPVLQLGVGEDLRNRLRSPETYYACLAATAATGVDRMAMATKTTATPMTNPAAIVGTVEVTWKRPYLWPLVGFDGPYIANLAVRSPYRRRGIARQLLSACETQAQAWHGRKLYLHVLETNQPARQLYASMGYKEHNVEPSWANQLWGQPRQLLLRKQL